MNRRLLVGVLSGFAIAIASTAAGAVGLLSHPVGLLSHPVGEFSQPVSANAEAGEYYYARASGVSGNQRASLYLWIQTSTESRGAALASTQELRQNGSAAPRATYVYASVSKCQNSNCTSAWATSTKYITYAITENELVGDLRIKGSVRGVAFDVRLQRSEVPHAIGDAFEWFDLRPGSQHPVRIFNHRYIDVGAHYRVTNFKVGAVSPQITSRSGAKARYGHADVQTFWYRPG